MQIDTSKPPLYPLDDLPSAELRSLVLELLGEVAALRPTVAEQREEIAEMRCAILPARSIESKLKEALQHFFKT